MTAENPELPRSGSYEELGEGGDEAASQGALSFPVARLPAPVRLGREETPWTGAKQTAKARPVELWVAGELDLPSRGWRREVGLERWLS